VKCQKNEAFSSHTKHSITSFWGVFGVSQKMKPFSAIQNTVSPVFGVF
jgi:hypothetical protein